MLRKLVSEYLGQNQKLIDIIERFNDLDRIYFDETLRFEDIDNHWKLAA